MSTPEICISRSIFCSIFPVPSLLPKFRRIDWRAGGEGSLNPKLARIPTLLGRLEHIKHWDPNKRMPAWFQGKTLETYKIIKLYTLATLTRKTLAWVVACEKNMLCFQGLQWHLMLIKLWYKWSTPGWVSTCSITRGSSRLHLLNTNPANHVFISYIHLESWIKVIENSCNSASNIGRSNASNPVLFLRHPAEMFLIKFETTTSYEYPWVPKPNKQLQQPLLPLPTWGLDPIPSNWLGPLLILSHFLLKKGTSFMILPCDFEAQDSYDSTLQDLALVLTAFLSFVEIIGISKPSLPNRWVFPWHHWHR